MYATSKCAVANVGYALRFGGGIAKGSGDAGLPFGEGSKRAGHGIAAQQVEQRATN